MSHAQIRYTRTRDGVNIAFSVLGQGAWLVFPSNVWGDLAWYLNDEGTRRAVDALAASGWRVVRYDARGMGASDRAVTDFSIEARYLDLEAVVDAAGAERFVLCGYGHGGPLAIMYSLRHPAEISHLVLVNSFAVGSEYYEKVPAMKALMGLRSMAKSQWEFFTMTLASANARFADAELAGRTAALFRGSMSAHSFLSFVKAAGEVDLTDALPSLQVPTLVVEDTSGMSNSDLSRALAAGIPDARFVTTNDYTQELQMFVTGQPVARQTVEHVEGGAPGETAVILFADIADSTGLTERLGDTAFRHKARDLDTALRTAIRGNGGTPIEGKLLGDGVLAVFGSARQAIEAAVVCARSGEAGGLPLHLGVHAGDVIREANNVYGGAVNIAARISASSAPGEILVSDTVRSLARTSTGVSFRDLGEQALKGVAEPVRVWAVGEQ